MADEEFALWVLLRQTTYAMIKAREKELAPSGLSPIGAAALYVIQTMPGPATPAEIARWLIREPHSVSGLLDRLERQGLVERHQDLERKNLVRIALTEKGQQVYEQARYHGLLLRIFSALSAEQRQQLATLLDVLLNQTLSILDLERPPYPTLESVGLDSSSLPLSS